MAANNATDTVENPFGLLQLWEQSGMVIRAILIILVIMSLASWYIILTKLWDQRRIRKAYKDVEKGFWTAGNLRDSHTAKPTTNADTTTFKTIVIRTPLPPNDPAHLPGPPR